MLGIAVFCGCFCLQIRQTPTIKIFRTRREARISSTFLAQHALVADLLAQSNSSRQDGSRVHVQLKRPPLETYGFEVSDLRQQQMLLLLVLRHTKRDCYFL